MSDAYRILLPTACTTDELGQLRLVLWPHLHLVPPPTPPLCDWIAITSEVALSYAATVVAALAARAGYAELSRSPKRVLAYTCEGLG
jgi:hypothetical protein